MNQSFNQESVSSRLVTNMGPTDPCFAREVLDMSLGKNSCVFHDFQPINLMYLNDNASFNLLKI